MECSHSILKGTTGSNRNHWLEIEWVEPQPFRLVEMDKDFHFIEIRLNRYPLQQAKGPQLPPSDNHQLPPPHKVCLTSSLHLRNPCQTSQNSHLNQEAATESPGLQEGTTCGISNQIDFPTT